MGPKKGKGKGGPVDGVDTTSMSREQLEAFSLRLREELDREREERNFFQLERDKLRTFWEITRQQLEENRAQLRNQDRAQDENEEKHQSEIKTYKQKVKHLLYEHQCNLSNVKVERMVALKMAQDEYTAMENELLKDKNNLKSKLREQELAHQEVIRQLKMDQSAEISRMREQFSQDSLELERKYEARLTTQNEELGLQQSMELAEVEQRKNRQVVELTKSHEKAFNDMKNYYNEITLNNLALISSLKEQMEELKSSHERMEKQLREVQTENKRLTEPLKQAQTELTNLQRQLASYEQDKITLTNTKQRLALVTKELEDLRWENEVLELRFEKVEKERDRLHAEFVGAVLDVQQKSGLKSAMLGKKMADLRGGGGAVSDDIVGVPEHHRRPRPRPRPRPAWRARTYPPPRPCTRPRRGAAGAAPAGDVTELWTSPRTARRLRHPPHPLPPKPHPSPHQAPSQSWTTTGTGVSEGPRVEGCAGSSCSDLSSCSCEEGVGEGPRARSCVVLEARCSACVLAGAVRCRCPPRLALRRSLRSPQRSPRSQSAQSQSHAAGPGPEAEGSHRRCTRRCRKCRRAGARGRGPDNGWVREASSENSPKGSTRTPPNGSRRSSPEATPKNSPKATPKNSPKATPKNSPVGSTKSSQADFRCNHPLKIAPSAAHSGGLRKDLSSSLKVSPRSSAVAGPAAVVGAVVVGTAMVGTAVVGAAVALGAAVGACRKRPAERSAVRVARSTSPLANAVDAEMATACAASSKHGRRPAKRSRRSSPTSSATSPSPSVEDAPVWVSSPSPRRKQRVITAHVSVIATTTRCSESLPSGPVPYSKLARTDGVRAGLSSLANPVRPTIPAKHPRPEQHQRLPRPVLLSPSGRSTTPSRFSTTSTRTTGSRANPAVFTTSVVRTTTPARWATDERTRTPSYRSAANVRPAPLYAKTHSLAAPRVLGVKLSTAQMSLPLVSGSVGGPSFREYMQQEESALSEADEADVDIYEASEGSLKSCCSLPSALTEEQAPPVGVAPAPLPEVIVTASSAKTASMPSSVTRSKSPRGSTFSASCRGRPSPWAKAPERDTSWSVPGGGGSTKPSADSASTPRRPASPTRMQASLQAASRPSALSDRLSTASSVRSKSWDRHADCRHPSTAVHTPSASSSVRRPRVTSPPPPPPQQPLLSLPPPAELAPGPSASSIQTVYRDASATAVNKAYSAPSLLDPSIGSLGAPTPMGMHQVRRSFADTSLPPAYSPLVPPPSPKPADEDAAPVQRSVSQQRQPLASTDAMRKSSASLSRFSMPAGSRRGSQVGSQQFGTGVASAAAAAERRLEHQQWEAEARSGAEVLPAVREERSGEGSATLIASPAPAAPTTRRASAAASPATRDAGCDPTCDLRHVSLCSADFYISVGTDAGILPAPAPVCDAACEARPPSMFSASTSALSVIGPRPRVCDVACEAHPPSLFSASTSALSVVPQVCDAACEARPPSVMSASTSAFSVGAARPPACDAECEARPPSVFSASADPEPRVEEVANEVVSQGAPGVLRDAPDVDGSGAAPRGAPEVDGKVCDRACDVRRVSSSLGSQGVPTGVPADAGVATGSTGVTANLTGKAEDSTGVKAYSRRGTTVSAAATSDDFSLTSASALAAAEATAAAMTESDHGGPPMSPNESTAEAAAAPPDTAPPARGSATAVPAEPPDTGGMSSSATVLAEPTGSTPTTAPPGSTAMAPTVPPEPTVAPSTHVVLSRVSSSICLENEDSDEGEGEGGLEAPSQHRLHCKSGTHRPPPRTPSIIWVSRNEDELRVMRESVPPSQAQLSTNPSAAAASTSTPAIPEEPQWALPERQSSRVSVGTSVSIRVDACFSDTSSSDGDNEGGVGKSKPSVKRTAARGDDPAAGAGAEVGPEPQRRPQRGPRSKSADDLKRGSRRRQAHSSSRSPERRASREGRPSPSRAPAAPATTTPPKMAVPASKDKGGKCSSRIKDWLRGLTHGRWAPSPSARRLNVQTSTSDLSEAGAKCSSRGRTRASSGSSPPRRPSRKDLFKTDRHAGCHQQSATGRSRKGESRRHSQHSVRFDLEASDSSLGSGLCHMATSTTGQEPVGRARSLPQLPRRGGLKRGGREEVVRRARSRSEARVAGGAADEASITVSAHRKDRHLQCFEERPVLLPPLSTRQRGQKTRTGGRAKTPAKRPKASARSARQRDDSSTHSSESLASSLPEKAVIWTKPGTARAADCGASSSGGAKAGAMWLMFPSLVTGRPAKAAEAAAAATTPATGAEAGAGVASKVDRDSGKAELRSKSAATQVDDGQDTRTANTSRDADTAREAGRRTEAYGGAIKKDPNWRSTSTARRTATLSTAAEPVVRPRTREAGSEATGGRHRHVDTATARTAGTIPHPHPQRTPASASDSTTSSGSSSPVPQVLSPPIVPPGGASASRLSWRTLKERVTIQEISSDDVLFEDGAGSTSATALGVTTSRLSCLQEETDSDVKLESVSVASGPSESSVHTSFNVADPVEQSRSQVHAWRAVEENLAGANMRHRRPRRAREGDPHPRRRPPTADDGMDEPFPRGRRCMRTRSPRSLPGTPATTPVAEGRSGADTPVGSRTPKVRFSTAGSGMSSPDEPQPQDPAQLKSAVEAHFLQQTPRSRQSRSLTAMRPCPSAAVEAPVEVPSPPRKPTRILVSRAKSTASLTGLHDLSATKTPAATPSTSEARRLARLLRPKEAMVVELYRKHSAHDDLSSLSSSS